MIEAREEKQLGSLRRQIITLRLADALIVTDSRLVIRVENMVTTSSLEVSEVDLNGWHYEVILFGVGFACSTFFPSHRLITSMSIL